MWRRLAIAVVLAALGVVAFLLLLVRSEAGGRNLCAVAEATLRDVSRERVVIGRCHVDPIGTRVVIEGVQIGPIERPYLAAERITAGLDARSLLAGKVRLDDVEILRPRVDADFSQHRAKDEVRPRRPRGTDCLPDLGPLEIGVLSIVGGELALKLPEGRALAARGLEVTVRGTGTKLEIGFTAEQTTLTDPSGEALLQRARLKADLDLATGEARVSSVDVSAREGSLFAQAEFANVCAPRGQATATLHVDLARLGETLLKDVENLGGKATIRARVKIDGTRFEATADIRVEDATVLQFAPGDFELSAKADPEQLTIERLELPLATGKLRASGTLGLKAPFAASAEANLDAVSLGEVMVKLGVDPFPVHLVATGTAQLAGPLQGPRGPVLTGSVDVAVPEFGVYDRTWQRRAGATRFVGLEKGALKGGFVLERDRLTLRNTRISAGETVVDTQGLIHFDSTLGMQLEVNAPSLSLRDLGPFGPAGIAGKGTLVGTVRGPYRWLDMEATASLREIDAMGIDVGQASAKARLRLDEMTLDVPETQGFRGRTGWRGSGHMGLAGTIPMEARVVLQKARAIDLAGMVMPLVPAMRVLNGNVDALLDGEVVLSGPARALNVDTILQLAEVESFGQRFPKGTVAARFIDGHVASVDKLRLERGEGYAKASGRFDITSESFEFLALTRKLRVGDFDAVADALPTLTGGVTFDAKGSGTLEAPQASGKMTLRDFRLGEQPLGTVRLGLGLEGRTVLLDGTIASPWPRETKPPPREPGAPYPLPPGSMFHVVHGEAELAGRMPFTLDVGLSVPDAATLLPPGTLGDVQAGLEGSLTASGELARLLSAQARLELSRLWIRKGRARIENARPAVATLEDGRVTLHALPLRGPSFELDAFGVRELDGRLDFEVEGGVDFALLRELVPDLDDARGRVDLRLSLTGTQQEPIAVGNAVLAGIGLRPKGLPIELTEGQGTVTFSPEAVVIDGINAKVNGGPILLSGQLDLDHFAPQRLEVRAEIGEIPLRFDDVPLTISGTPVLSGTFDALNVGGEIELTRLRFQRNVELDRLIVQALEVLRRPPAPKVFSRSGEFLTLDLGVRLGDVRIDNNLLNADLRGDLRVTGTNRRPGLLGAVTIVDGRAFVRNNEFILSSGVINFTDRSRIRPAFDVRADAQVREYLVHVTASGTPQQPRVLLSSEPPLSNEDIVTLLTLGVTSRDFDRAGSASVTGVLLDAAYNASGINDQIKAFLPRSELLKDAQFRVTSAYSEISGNIEPIAQFESKLYRDELKLRGQTSLLGGRGRRAQLEYRWSENISAQLQWDADNPNAPSLGDIGGDLKFHREWP